MDLELQLGQQSGGWPGGGGSRLTGTGFWAGCVAAGFWVGYELGVGAGKGDGNGTGLGLGAGVAAGAG